MRPPRRRRSLLLGAHVQPHSQSIWLFRLRKEGAREGGFQDSVRGPSMSDVDETRSSDAVLHGSRSFSGATVYSSSISAPTRSRCYNEVHSPNATMKKVSRVRTVIIRPGDCAGRDSGSLIGCVAISALFTQICNTRSISNYY